MAELSGLLKDFVRHPAATESAITNFEVGSGVRLPSGYKAFLRESNGGEGFVGDAYLMLWPIDQLLKLNSDYQVEKYAAGITLFGSDGGGEAFAFDSSGDVIRIISIPFIGFEREYASPIAADFPEFFLQVSKV